MSNFRLHLRPDVTYSEAMLISGASKQISCAILDIFDLIIYWRFDLSQFFLYPKLPYHVVDCGFYKNDELMIFQDLGWPFHRLTVKKTWMNDSWTVFFLDIINLIHICKTLSMLQSSNSLTDTTQKNSKRSCRCHQDHFLQHKICRFPSKMHLTG